MPERQPFVKKESIKSVELKEGQFVHNFLFNTGTEWPIHLSIPEIKEDQKVPLIIALHWAGSGDSYIEFSSCLAFPALQFLNGIIVAPSSRFGNWANVTNEKKVIDLIKRLTKHWPIDKEKIIITGYSNGAIGGWEYARKHPKLFKAVLPVSGFYEAHKIKVPVYALHGEGDELFSIIKVKKSLEESKKKGSVIHLKSLPGFGHYDACSYVNELQMVAKQLQADLLIGDK